MTEPIEHGRNVVPFRRGAMVDQGPVFEGELLTDAESRAVERRLAAQKAAKHVAVRTVQAARVVVRHEHTKTVVRHAVAYPTAGAGVVVRRWRDTHGATRYERQMRAAEAAGDQEALRYWQEADVAEKARRHARVMDWFKAPTQLAKAAAIGLLGLAGFLLVLGVILATHTGRLADVTGPIVAVANAVAFLVWFFITYGVFLLLAATAGGVIYLYRQGRMHAEMPQWLAGTALGSGDVMDELPDEGMIINALKNLNIRGFNQAMKEGWRVKFLSPPYLDGKGWRAQLALPPACPVEEIVRKKTMLAHNLVRYPREVWPTEPQASVLDLWVAKPGALSGPVDPWPLLDDLDSACADYFEGVPAAVTIKGDVVRGRLFEANYGIGGMMGSGKSTLAITLILGAMLDPLVDIDVVVMAENADYEPMAPRLRSLVTGAGEGTVDTCMSMLSGLYDGLSLRGQALREHDERSVTRRIAEIDPRLRPQVVVVDECQNLFMGKHGKGAIEVASKLMSTARKYAITLMFLTPEPSKDALPRKLMSIISNKACFAIGDQVANDAVLGTGSYKSGISAVGLTPKTDEGPGDVGTCMARGFTAKPGLLRSFYVPQADAYRVTQRALQLRAGAGRTAVEPEQRDLLADVACVLGVENTVKARDVAARLRELAPAWRPYQGLTADRLAAGLLAEGVAVRKLDGTLVVRTPHVHSALAQREVS